MITDRGLTVPDDGPTVSIVDPACGTVVGTRDVAAVADLVAGPRAHAARPVSRRSA